VLEVFLYGGISPWESFWVVPDHGRPDDPMYGQQQWYLWQDRHEAVFRNRCRVDMDLLEDFGTDDLGRPVQWGPLVAPLRVRPDLMARTRVLAMRHDLEPHEAAIPYTLAGFRLGNPRMCGMGAHVQRHLLDRDGARSVPYSYVFEPGDVAGTDNVRAASSVGQHPGSARPLTFRVAQDDGLTSLLDRPVYGDRRGAVDAWLADRYDKQRARHSADGVALRSRALTDHGFALDGLANAGDLSAVLGADFLAPQDRRVCGRTSDSSTARSLAAAVSLLKHPTSPAGYVNVIDTGLITADGGGGYDTHGEHLATQTMNALHLLDELVSHINAPGENDPSKLDLDETMIILTTEFGRTPVPQAGGRGTNHFPWGYAQALIGGPIQAPQSGVFGSIGPDGFAETWVSPSEFRIGCLAAMGIWPFSQESFAVSDVRLAGSELAALERAITNVLGRNA
jgi:hypothetical protein